MNRRLNLGGNYLWASRKFWLPLTTHLWASVVFEQSQSQLKGMSLILFHCINSDNLSQITFLTEAKETKLSKLKHGYGPYCQKAKDGGIPTECVCSVGQPGPSIPCESWGANLIILGRKDAPGLKMLLECQQSRRAQCPCSVLIIKEALSS